jgi:hypothetical protein
MFYWLLRRFMGQPGFRPLFPAKPLAMVGGRMRRWELTVVIRPNGCSELMWRWPGQDYLVGLAVPPDHQQSRKVT